MTLHIALISLHTSPDDDPGSGDVGGMNVAVRSTAIALAAQGHTVEILTRRTDPAGSAAHELAPRVIIRHLDAGPAERRVKGDHEGFIPDFRRALEPLGPYDVIHSHHWFSGEAALEYARSRGIPHVQSFHSIAADPSTPLSEGERPESPGRMLGEAHLAQASDAVITVSSAERDTVVERLGASPAHVVVVTPGVDADLFIPATTPAARPGYIVAAARLEPLKGLDLAIEAIAALPDSIRPELVLAGGPTTGHDSYPADLRAHADAHGLADGIRFVGPQSRNDLAALLRGARMLLVPSHSETYGLVALEAAASGIPVVATASGGLLEAVDDGVTGLLLDSREPAVWTDAISRLLTDDALAARIGTAARVRAERFTWDRTAAATADVYTRLLNHRTDLAS
ncbi:D-inositol-3-phosphate glycosyltransferase [Mycetocola sp. CAN_C7]|uniref:glycosyltransferase n=1 Tax=Mycetocola sp. CAN_C7 TaxID=2787724 RepID=UPI001A2B0439